MINLDQELSNINSVAIVGHVKPDGDCVGSCLAMYNYIEKNYPGILADVYLNPIPGCFNILRNADKIRHFIGNDLVEDIADFAKCMQGSYFRKEAYDLCIVVDCGEAKRVGAAYAVFNNSKRTICIDHHMNKDSFGDENYVIPDYSSTCEMVFNLFDEDKIDKSIAECLYTGIVSDTGVFQYDCTSSTTMTVAGKLMDKGIDYSYIVEHTFFEKTFTQQRILGTALLKAKRVYNDKIIYAYIDTEELEELGANSKDFEGICEKMRETKGVGVAFYMHRQPDGKIKGSLRATDDVDLSRVASHIGGGGHKKAAGFTLDDMPMEDAANKVIEEIIREYEIENK